MGTDAKGSILIAAHNEASTIGVCLDQLGSSLRSGSYELVVVANGCTDATAVIASGRARDAADARAVELEVPSKSAALRRGDEILTRFPRIYLDADIRISEDTVDRLFDELTATADARVAAPQLRIDASASSWPVRRYFEVWTRLPYIAGGVIGVGVYAVNEAGKKRIGTFPDLLNDDEWVRQHFSHDERLITAGEFVSRAATSVRSLVRQRARVDSGNRQIRENLPVDEPGTSVGDLVSLVRCREVGILDAAVFLGVVMAARALAAWRRRRGTSTMWSMDLTSRSGFGSDA